MNMIIHDAMNKIKYFFRAAFPRSSWCCHVVVFIDAVNITNIWERCDSLALQLFAAAVFVSRCRCHSDNLKY